MIEETDVLQDPSMRTMQPKPRELKKLYSQKVRADSHLDFIKECKRIHSTPKGLRVNVKCHAHYSNVSKTTKRVQQQRACRRRVYYIPIRTLPINIQSARGKNPSNRGRHSPVIKRCGTDHLEKMETTLIKRQRRRKKIETLLQSSATNNRGGEEKRGRIASKVKRYLNIRDPLETLKKPRAQITPRKRPTSIRRY